MMVKKVVAIQRESLLSLQGLVEVYQEVAARRMQKVRWAVVQSRLFMGGLVEVFRKVRSAYRTRSANLKSVMRLNGRTVAVFVSANAGLYGDIVDRVFYEFCAYVRKNRPDVVVLGKLGVKMMLENLPEVLYNFFDFADERIDMESFDMIMRYLIQFEKIVVFHGQFKNILVQDVVATAVSGEAIEEQVEGGMGRTQFLFEPSVEDISRIFEGEILASVFEQSLHESMLAKFASRMLALEQSLENIDKRLEWVKIEERRAIHAIRGRKQLNTMSGMALWR